jgi:hypothetical protein
MAFRARTFPDVRGVAKTAVSGQHGWKGKNMKKHQIRDIETLREYFVAHGGFSGGWNVRLEGWTVEQALHHRMVAVSPPLPVDSWQAKSMAGLATETQIGNGLAVLTVDWQRLVNRVCQDATRERLLVMITGCLWGDEWEKAIRFSGRTDGLIRRSLVGVPLGEQYWQPTKEQLASVA